MGSWSIYEADYRFPGGVLVFSQKDNDMGTGFMKGFNAGTGFSKLFFCFRKTCCRVSEGMLYCIVTWG